MINQKIQLTLVSVFISTSIMGCSSGNSREIKNSPTVQTTATQSITSTQTAITTPTTSVAPTKEIVIDKPQIPKPDQIELIIGKQSKIFNKDEDNYNKLYNAVERMIYNTTATRDLLMDYIGAIESLKGYKENAIIYRYNEPTELKFKKFSEKRDGLLFPLFTKDITSAREVVAYTLKKNDEYNGPIAFPEAEKSTQEALRLLAEEISEHKISP